MQFITNDPNSYTMKLSAQDTYDWATGDPFWPCSALRSKRLVVVVDSNGLLDMTANGKDFMDIEHGVRHGQREHWASQLDSVVDRLKGQSYEFIQPESE